MPNKTYRWILTAIIAGFILPPLLYWFSFLRVPLVSLAEAQEILEQNEPGTVLVDVRPARAYRAAHIDSAVNIPLEHIKKQPPQAWQSPLENKARILVYCNMGISSSMAVKRLRKLGFTNARSIDGGLEAWQTRGKRGDNRGSCLLKTPGGDKDPLPRHTFTLTEQLVISVSAFGVKPLYEILALLIVILLWRYKDPDLAAVRRAMIAFLIGENGCAVNFVFFNDQSHFLEFVHSYGMLVAFGLFFHALMKALDIRVLKFTAAEDTCTLLPLCKECYKYRPTACKLRLLFLYVIPASAVVALMPLTAPLGSHFIKGEVFGGDVLFGHPMVRQIFEIRLCPILALVCFAIAFTILLLKKEKGFEASKIFYAMGLGPLAFGVMRFLIFWGYYRTPLWADVWEELTELLFIVMLLWVVLQIRDVRESIATFFRSKKTGEA